MSDEYFTSENINKYLNEIAKSYKKMTGGHMKAEIILVGGAAILANYQFRQKSYDIDAAFQKHSVIKDAADAVGRKFNLPDNWFNSDFMNTKSYTPKLSQYSVHYREFNHILEVRTMPPEYIIAMKLMAGREYKHDLSDVAGILIEQKENGNPLSIETVTNAICNLYEDVANIPEKSIDYLITAFETDNLYQLVETTMKKEEHTKELLMQFEKDYENVLNENNLSEILKQLQRKQNSDYPDME